jgi:hypothetical protein
MKAVLKQQNNWITTKKTPSFFSNVSLSKNPFTLVYQFLNVKSSFFLTFFEGNSRKS